MQNRKWSSVEHYFQAQKFIYPNCSEKSLEYANLIANASTPDIAKVLATQRIRNATYPWRMKLNPIIDEYLNQHKVLLRLDWDIVKDDIMYESVLQKFLQNYDLQKFLLETNETRLVEHTHRDSYWADGGDGSGKNKLGEILMRVRHEIRNRNHQK